METPKQRNKKVLVCQHGSRHRYAVPRMLEQSDMLAALYTDSSATSPLGKLGAGLGAFTPAALQRLSRREISGVSGSKIRSSDRYHIHELLFNRFPPRKHGIDMFLQRHKILSRQMIKWGLTGAGTVYSMYYENLDFLRWAKSNGARLVVDVFISPVTDAIMQAEYEKWPDWKNQEASGAAEIRKRLWEEAAELADVLLCPSEWVAEGVRKATPEAADKIEVVPYGCSIDYQGKINQPVEGRVLFAGGEVLRKGLHYLGQAATQLKSSLPNLDVRIAGSIPQEIMHHSICQDLNFLGMLDKPRMQDEYLMADVFTLPSLSEGFAGVVAEALGAGCPVIVTKEAGSPVQDGREGLVVPSGDPHALAAAITRLVTDRKLRSHCSAECLEQAPFYSIDQWRKRLVFAILEGSI